MSYVGYVRQLISAQLAMYFTYIGSHPLSNFFSYTPLKDRRLMYKYCFLLNLIVISMFIEMVINILWTVTSSCTF